MRAAATPIQYGWSFYRLKDYANDLPSLRLPPLLPKCLVLWSRGTDLFGPDRVASRALYQERFITRSYWRTQLGGPPCWLSYSLQLERASRRVDSWWCSGLLCASLLLASAARRRSVDHLRSCLGTGWYLFGSDWVTCPRWRCSIEGPSALQPSLLNSLESSWCARYFIYTC